MIYLFVNPFLVYEGKIAMKNTMCVCRRTCDVAADAVGQADDGPPRVAVADGADAVQRPRDARAVVLLERVRGVLRPAQRRGRCRISQAEASEAGGRSGRRRRRGLGPRFGILLFVVGLSTFCACSWLSVKC